MPPLPADSGFRIGTVEGFFGRQWSWQARSDHASFLARQGFTTYLYAPKNDAFLRKQWFEPYPAEAFAGLKSLAGHAAGLKLEFGVGLSPFELYRDFSAANRERLLRKIDQLNALQAPLLAVLFDDMMGELPGLAETQLAIFDCIKAHSNARAFALCPTYYSDDPALVKHFGRQPERYLETLGRSLAPDVEVFWTGPRVISQAYPRDHLLELRERLGRKPLLWDNYPVNDAKRLTPFLHLLPFERRQQAGERFDLANIRDLCSGLLANPMNQAYLSQLPLTSLARLLHGQASTVPAAAGVLQCLIEDADLFASRGLEALTPDEHSSLLQRYQALLPDPMAREVCEWLQGLYAFDPACLT
ncbi:MAG TPA: beta-N-acetylglucosaminidase domain-containing protein [Candidatus Acidoferrum sp.]|nr:beta-N-acetylglucosaminidase domain-containing protein [Candidatus Acidoferrum sp.]